MSIDSSDIFKLASSLAEEAKHEVEHRNIMSLAYYSSYHAIKPHLSNNAPNGHTALADYLCAPKRHKDEKIQSKDLRALGLLLDGLKTKRIHADYFLSKKMDLTDSEESLAEATMFQQVLNEVIAKLPQKSQA